MTFRWFRCSVRSLLGHSCFQAVSTLQADQEKLEVIDVKPAVCLVLEVTDKLLHWAGNLGKNLVKLRFWTSSNLKAQTRGSSRKSDLD